MPATLTKVQTCSCTTLVCYEILSKNASCYRASFPKAGAKLLLIFNMAKLFEDFFEDFMEDCTQKAGLEEYNGGKFFPKRRNQWKRMVGKYTLLYYIREREFFL